MFWIFMSWKMFNVLEATTLNLISAWNCSSLTKRIKVRLMHRDWSHMCHPLRVNNRPWELVAKQMATIWSLITEDFAILFTPGNSKFLLLPSVYFLQIKEFLIRQSHPQNWSKIPIEPHSYVMITLSTLFKSVQSCLYVVPW